MPSRLHISAMDYSPRNPSITIAIFSSELNCLLDLRLMSLIVASDFLGLPGPLFMTKVFCDTLKYKVSINISNFCPTYADDLHGC